MRDSSRVTRGLRNVLEEKRGACVCLVLLSKGVGGVVLHTGLVAVAVVVWCGTGVVEKTARELIVKIATALPALHLLDTSPLLRIFPLLHSVTRAPLLYYIRG